MKKNTSRQPSFLLTMLTTAIFASYSTLSYSAQFNNVDTLIKNGIILTINNQDKIYNDGYVAIKDNKIVSVGSGEDLKKFKANTVINADGGIVMPGFINTHTHIAMTIFRSLADDMPNRLHDYVFPLEKSLLTPSLVKASSLEAASELIKGGTTTFADMYLFEDSVADAVKSSGLRAILAQNIIDFPTADATDAQDAIKKSVNFIKKYHNDPLITPAFGPHAPYTTSTDTMKKVTELAKKYNVPVMTHLAESEIEKKTIQEKYGMSPVQYLNSIGALNDRLIAAHVINVDDKDIELLKANDVGVAHNLSSNLKSGKGVAPAIKMYNDGLRIGLGTDGAMSGNSQSVLDELNIVAKVHKGSDVLKTTPKVVIRMATIDAARALHMEDKIGSLEKGKLADIIIIGTKDSNIVPVYNPYSTVVYSAKPYNVTLNMVNGKVLMKDKEIVSFDAKDASNKFIDYQKTVLSKLKEMGKSVQ